MCEIIHPMLKNALALVLFCLAAFAEPVLAEPVVEIPFRFTDGFICIEARLAQSSRPLNLMLDSGAGASVLSLRTARRLNPRSVAIRSLVTDPRVGNLLSCGVQVWEASVHA